MYVKPKKHLGQHFLTDLSIAQKISDSLQARNTEKALEIGPGTGVLTQFLLKRKDFQTFVIEIDKESVEYLDEEFPELDDRILSLNFLKFDLKSEFDEQIAIIGNFPYNISSQILFRVLEFREMIPEVVGMFQKEVAERIASPEGSKKYGILSVLIQAFYDVEYLFSVDPNVFNPPPRVNSGVLRLQRKENLSLDCDEKLFFRVVKASFNHRRKTLNNSLKPIIGKEKIDDEIMLKRPEQLNVDRFVYLTNLVAEVLKNKASDVSLK